MMNFWRHFGYDSDILLSITVDTNTCQHSHTRLRELCKDTRVGGNGESRFERQGQRGTILPPYYSVDG